MKGVIISFILMVIVIIMASCSDDNFVMDEEMEDQHSDTVEVSPFEPIGIDTHSLRACYPGTLGPFKEGFCRLKYRFEFTESINPGTGETIITKTDTFEYLYNEDSQLIFYESSLFTDTLLYLHNGSLYKSILSKTSTEGAPPETTTYYYDLNENISYILFERWNQPAQVDSFYYDDLGKVINIKTWPIKSDGSLGELQFSYSFTYHDKKLLKSIKTINYQCIDFCNVPNTVITYFWDYLEITDLTQFPRFIHYNKMINEYPYLNRWVYAYDSDKTLQNQGYFGDIINSNFNEYGYLISPSDEYECFD